MATTRTLKGLLAAAIVVALAISSIATAPAATAAGEEIKFEGGGWGHGVGMSQYGAFGRASAGHTAEQILGFYYHNTTVEAPGGLLATLRLLAIPTSLNQARPDAATVTAIDGGALTVRILGNPSAPVPSTDVLVTGLTGPILATRLAPVNGMTAWSIVDKAGTASATELCSTACRGERVSVIPTSGQRYRLSSGTSTIGDRHNAGIATIVAYNTTGIVGLIDEIPLEKYLEGIAEVPSSWPAEALKAQAISARSYAVVVAAGRRTGGSIFDLHATTYDQVYRGAETQTAAWSNAVSATAGKVIRQNSKTVATYYSSSNGGMTAASQESFVTALPYLIAQPDPFDAGVDSSGKARNPYHRWTRTYTLAELSQWFSQDTRTNVGTLQSLNLAGAPGPSGRLDDTAIKLVGSAGTKTVNGAVLRSVINARAGSGRTLLSTLFGFGRFSDVPTNAYYATAVDWLVANNITTGVTPTTFEPNGLVQRSQMAAFLHRFMGAPPSSFRHSFTDVVRSSYYGEPVAWLVEKGITNGRTPTTFVPNGIVTRGELATFLWRLAGKPTPSKPAAFSDVAANTFYASAVAWLVEAGVTNGTTPTTFSPNQPIDRGQMATFLYRLARSPEDPRP